MTIGHRPTRPSFESGSGRIDGSLVREVADSVNEYPSLGGVLHIRRLTYRDSRLTQTDSLGKFVEAFAAFFDVFPLL